MRAEHKQDVTAQMVETGAVKAVMPVWRQLMLGVLAGVCVSLGAFLALSISGNNPALSANHPGLYRLLFGAFGCVTLVVEERTLRVIIRLHDACGLNCEPTSA